MNIKEIRTKIISVPFLDPPKTSFLPLQTIDLLIVEIETTEGFIGTGHLHPIAGGLLTIEMCINEMLKPLLIGETIKNIEYLWLKMWKSYLYSRKNGNYCNGHVCY